MLSRHGIMSKLDCWLPLIVSCIYCTSAYHMEVLYCILSILQSPDKAETMYKQNAVKIVTNC